MTRFNLARHRVTFAALAASAALHAAVIVGLPAGVHGLREEGPATYDVMLIPDPDAAVASVALAPRPAARRARPRPSPPKPEEAVAYLPDLITEAGAEVPASEAPADESSPTMLAGEEVQSAPEKVALAETAAPIRALEPPKFPTQALPAKLSIEYALSSAFADGRAEYTWTREGDRYEIEGILQAAGFVTNLILEGRITQRSRGIVTSEGLRPESFVERKPGSADEGLTFDWDKRRMTFSRKGESREGPLTENTVDWLSMIFQLAHVPPATESVELRVFTQRRFYTFTLDSLGVEEIEIPIGKVRALHLRHRGNAGNEAVDVWLGIDHQHLPVKMRYPVARNRFMVEQVATSISAAR